VSTSEALASLGRRYVFNERVLAAASEGFSDADWARPPGPHGGNSAHWLLAHLVRTRRELLRACGDELAREGWESGYGRGSRSVLHEATPPPAALAEEFARLGTRLGERLATLPREHADRPFLYPLPDGGRSLADGAHFLYFHESYHLGQIGLLRRIGGKAGFV
jgi:hypothetical protein